MTVSSVFLKILSVLLIVFTSACVPEKVSSTFIGDGSSGGWTRSPSGWESSRLKTPDAARSIQGFWAPGGSPDKVLVPSDVLSGILQSQSIPRDREDLFEVAAVGVVFPDYNAALQSVATELYRDTQVIDGLRYIRLSFKAKINSADIVVEQISVTDKSNGKVQSIAVGCSPLCFNKEISTIKSILNSWKADI
ncbi:MAG: hypothetical protein ACKOW9_04895 [Candidatus Paceibacterota bacterium]